MEDVTLEKVEWFSFTGAEKNDSNEGKRWGIVAYDENDNFIEAFWYRNRFWRHIAYLLLNKEF